MIKVQGETLQTTSDPHPMQLARNDGLFNLVFAAIFFLICLLVGFIVVLSLRWHISIDTPIMLYFGFLIDHAHFVPYRDFWENNLPGTYVVSVLLGRLSGYNDFNLRVLDLAYLSVTLVVTWQALKDFGGRVSVCAVLLFAMVYLGAGTYASFQRDAWFLLPLALAIFVGSATPRWNDALRCFTIGLLFGLMATVKPHSALGLPPIWLFAVADIRERRRIKWLPVAWTVPLILAVAAGFLVPILAILAYLWQIGGLNALIDITVNFQPLYVNITGTHGVLFGWERLSYLASNFFVFGGYQVWFIPAAAAIYLVWAQSSLSARQKRFALLLIGLVICYAIYPVIGGQFVTYQYLPFVYCIVLLSALCFAGRRTNTSLVVRWLPMIVPVAALVGGQFVSYDFATQMSKPGSEAPRDDRAYEIASYLQAHLKPGDKVQPIDWASGALHSMLLARAEIATPYLYDFPFHYFVSTPYVQGLRHKFIAALQAAKPRYILVMTVFRWPDTFGPDTSGRFEQLEQVLATDYRLAVSGNGYLIYERNAVLTI